MSLSQNLETMETGAVVDANAAGEADLEHLSTRGRRKLFVARGFLPEKGEQFTDDLSACGPTGDDRYSVCLRNSCSASFSDGGANGLSGGIRNSSSG